MGQGSTGRSGLVSFFTVRERDVSRCSGASAATGAPRSGARQRLGRLLTGTARREDDRNCTRRRFGRGTARNEPANITRGKVGIYPMKGDSHYSRIAGPRAPMMRESQILAGQGPLPTLPVGVCQPSSAPPRVVNVPCSLLTSAFIPVARPSGSRRHGGVLSRF